MQKWHFFCCDDQISNNFLSKHLSIKNKVVLFASTIPARFPFEQRTQWDIFLFMGVRYTNQAITTEQQIETLKQKGLLIDDVEQATKAFYLVY